MNKAEQNIYDVFEPLVDGVLEVAEDLYYKLIFQKLRDGIDDETGTWLEPLLDMTIQNYKGIIGLLKQGNVLDAAVLLRIHFELTITIFYLFKHENEAERFYEYFKVAEKLKLDNRYHQLHTKRYDEEECQLIEDGYKGFVNKYGVKTKKEKYNWSGKTVKDLALSLEDNLGKFLYAKYCEYSAALHVSSSIHEYLEYASSENYEQVPHKYFVESLTLPGQAISMILTVVICREEICQEFQERVFELYEGFGKKLEEANEWAGIWRGYHFSDEQGEQ